MENLTREEIELCLTALSRWEQEFRVSSDNWKDVDLLEEKLERMKSTFDVTKKHARRNKFLRKQFSSINIDLPNKANRTDFVLVCSISLVCSKCGNETPFTFELPANS